jgi:hypothetical protein
LRRHVAPLFADAEEPPDIRTERMGSSWFWRHPPMPAQRLELAIVLDLTGGRADAADVPRAAPRVAPGQAALW